VPAIESSAAPASDPEASSRLSIPLAAGRLYSISPSSHEIAPQRLALTSIAVRFRSGRTLGRFRLDLLPDRIGAGQGPTPMFMRPHHFALPADSSVPVVHDRPRDLDRTVPRPLFLNDARMATKAPGATWLFFGHQRSATTSSVTRTAFPE